MTAETSTPHVRGFLRSVLAWAREASLERKLALFLLIGATSSGTATFVAMTSDLPAAADPRIILLLLVVDLLFLLGLSGLIGRRLTILWIETKRGMAGARLHGRLAALFALVAVTPTIIVATFSVMLFDFGLKAWFSERVSTAVLNSLAVAQAYVEEHRQTITADSLSMAQVLNRAGPTLVYNPQLFSQVVTQQANRRSLTEAAVYDSAGRLLARASSFLLAFNPEIPDWALERANNGEVVIMTSDGDDRVRALVRLEGFGDAYLYIGRLVDSRVLGHLDRTQGAVQLYEELEGDRYDLQITFALIFAVVALMLLLAAIWVGLTFANNLTVPIGNLIIAAERVGTGDLSARVKGIYSDDEIGNLARAFNRMTSELESQQRKLLEANRQLDYRSRFIEAVVSGVSAGVIGLDRDGKITLPNRTACEILDASAADLRGRDLTSVAPEMGRLLKLTRRWPNRVAEKQISISGADGVPRTLFVRIAAEVDEDGIIGYVVTFDDITELLSAQRKAAWSDIARRIAHEIKNPLTPIQLSAERLKRKYLGQIQEDPETFQICTDTIVRHVGDIGKMVDEFSSFARMPAPVMDDENLGNLIEQAIFLQRSANPEIEFVTDMPGEAVVRSCDSQQIGRALTNILLNAIEAIEARVPASGEELAAGRVSVTLTNGKDGCVVEVVDNGRGLPKAERHRLTEPYVTTRDRGTGLGLAIVKKIMEDHGGNLVLEDNPKGGARVRLTFPPPEVVSFVRQA